MYLAMSLAISLAINKQTKAAFSNRMGSLRKEPLQTFEFFIIKQIEYQVEIYLLKKANLFYHLRNYRHPIGLHYDRSKEIKTFFHFAQLFGV